MTQQLPPSQIAERISRAVAFTKKDQPTLAAVLDAFEPVLVETAIFKDRLSLDETFNMPRVDEAKFLEGVPLGDRTIFQVSSDDVKLAASALGPAICKGFPAIQHVVTEVIKALEQGSIDPGKLFFQSPEQQIEAMAGMAEAMGTNPAVPAFVIGRLTKPFVEKRAQWLGQSIEGLQWNRGYCPICGSSPAMSLLQGKEGQRWLLCSLCAHEWRFSRIACPFCENSDPKGLRFFYAEGRDAERIEVCRNCRGYVLGVDLRDRTDDVVMDVVALALVELQALAEQTDLGPEPER